MKLVLPNANSSQVLVKTGGSGSQGLRALLGLRVLLGLGLFWAGATTLGCHDGAGTTTPGMDLGTADGFPGLSDCPGVPLSQNGTLDVNLRSLKISGMVTLNGAALPSATASRGSILFQDKRTRTAATYDLGLAGAGSYALVLAPGQYDILFVANPSLCKSPTNTLPCSGGTLKGAMQLSAAGVLDLDLRSVVVQGRVTVNGAAIPAANQASGAIAFKGSGQTPVSTDATGSSTGLASYRLVLLQGSYEVDLQAPPSCTVGSPLPCVSGPLKAVTPFTADGTLDLDIPAVQVSGTIQVNGQAVASTDYKYGTVTFQLSGGGLASTDVTNVGNGLAPYQLKLLGGAYDVAYEPRNNDCTAGVPCIAGSLKKGAALQSSGTLDLNIPMITAQGNVTINAQPVVAANETGSLEFRNADGGAVLTATTGPRKLGAYKVTLLPSTYQVSYLPQSATCLSPVAKGPCVGGPIKKGLLLQTTGTLDLDIPSISVSGRVTVNGSAVAGAGTSRGRLVFQLSDGAGISTPDLNAYTLRLLPGGYQVSYAFAGPTCLATETIPCASGVLKPSQSLTTTGTLDIDIPLVQANGSVTLDGLPMPAITATRGQLQFILGGSAFVTPNFGSSGVVNYSVALLPGTYEIAHLSDFTVCSASTGSVPCVGQIVAGCM